MPELALGRAPHPPHRGEVTWWVWGEAPARDNHHERDGTVLHSYTRMARGRFDIDLLDLEDPFEIDDGNTPHLAKHAPFTHETLDEAWRFGEPRFFEAASGGAADWLMIAEVTGEGLVIVPLAPGTTVHQCRPIGIYKPNRQQQVTYWQSR